MSTTIVAQPVNPLPTSITYDWGNNTVIVAKRGHTRTYPLARFQLHDRHTIIWRYRSRFHVKQTPTTTSWRLLSEDEYAKRDAKRVARNRKAQQQRAAVANGHHFLNRYASNAGGR